MTTQFEDTEFQFGLELALGATYRQAADAGEVLATADRISDGDSDSWVQEWTATAEGAGRRPRSGLAGHQVSALAYYRRGRNLFRDRAVLLLRRTDHSPRRELELWRRQRASWERIVDLVGGERRRHPLPEDTRCRASSSGPQMPSPESRGRWS